MSPPVFTFDVPLTPGKTWTTLSDVGPRIEEFTFVVEGSETITVPAGTFETTRIAAYVAGSFYYHNYVAEGVGMVKRGIYVLEAYRREPVRSESATLSAVKELYR